MKHLAAAVVAVVVLPVVFIGAAMGAVGSAATSGGSATWPGVGDVVTDIPAGFAELYHEAAERYGVPWEVLAGVGKIECDHGRRPGCDKPNAAGAVGPMQFLPATFAAYATAAGSAAPSILDPRDAIFAAAALLAADGVTRDPAAALFAYNHASWYVAEVVAWAVAYGWAPPEPVLADAALHHPNLDLRADAAADISAGRVDPRVLAVLLTLATHHHLAAVGPFVTGHAELVAGTDRVSNHAAGRAVDLPVVDGATVSADNLAALAVAQEVASLAPPLRPDELGAPWPLAAAPIRSFTDGHDDHLHVGFDAQR